jgi:hypothetical protein
MGRNMLMPSAGRGGGGKFVGLLVVGFALILLVRDPVGAGHAVHNALVGLGRATDSLSTFAKALGL